MFESGVSGPTAAGRGCSRRAAAAGSRGRAAGTGRAGRARRAAGASGAGRAAWRTGCTSPAWARTPGRAPPGCRRAAACLCTTQCTNIVISFCVCGVYSLSNDLKTMK